MSTFAGILDVDLTGRLVFASVDVILVAVLVWALCAVLRPRSARLRALLWLLVPVKGLAALLLGSPFVLGLPWFETRAAAPVAASAPGPSEPDASTAVAPSARANPAIAGAGQPAAGARSAAVAARRADDSAAVDPAGSTVGGAVSILWLLGVVVLAAVSVRDRFVGARLVRRSTRGPAAWRRIVERHAAELRVRPPALRRTSELDSPALVGVLRPVILLPHWMSSADGVEWAIRHEVMHVAMRDPWAAFVRELGRIAFFFHPAVWLAGRKWEEASELACDRALVRDEDESLDYADRLHSLASRARRPEPALAHGLFAARSRVGKRIEALLEVPAGPARLSRAGAAGVASLFALTLAAGAGMHVSNDFVFTGSVRDHDGKPVAGALVVASKWTTMDGTCVELATANTDADGRFTLGYDRDDLPFEPSAGDPWDYVMLTAHAQNHGIDWVYQKGLAKLDGIELRLPRDYTLKGKLADEDGHPLPGVELRAVYLHATKEGSLDAWCTTLADGGSSELKKNLRVPSGRTPRAVTDATGAFELRGAGAERLVQLQHQGGDAAFGRVWMATREIDAELLAKRNQRPMTEPVLSSGAMAIVGRTRPIEGVVVDAATGAPIAGADVYGQAFAGMVDPAREMRTRTDDQGRFRILGVPRGVGNLLVVVPRGDEPYFLRDVQLPNSEGAEPIEVRVALHKGVWITGKVVDGVSGKPVRGLISYHPHLFNPLVLQIDPFKDRTVNGSMAQTLAGASFAARGAHRTAADGTFRIPGLPGRGLVGVEAFGHYRFGAGYDPKWDEQKPGAPEPRSFYVTDRMQVAPGPDWPNAMALVEVAEAGTPPPVTLTLDPGKNVTVTVLDAAGKRTTDYELKPSARSNRNVRKTQDGTLEVLRLAPNEQRLLELRRPDRSAGIIARIGAAQPTATLQLQPSATILGTLLDTDGVPIVGQYVELYLMPRENTQGDGMVKTDANGQFRVTVLPGSEYHLYVGSRRYKIADTQAVKPGETIDLGTKRVPIQ